MVFFTRRLRVCVHDQISYLGLGDGFVSNILRHNVPKE